MSAARPNIVWISIEDTGQEVEPYDLLAKTPNIARLAAEGVTFLNAFSHAPVCAPTRSGIITGMYPTSIGTQHMRSRMVPPAYVKAFPEYLRAAGYYATNNSKTDYNFEDPSIAWDESGKDAHWKNRPDREQPFFAVFNLTTSHESRIGRQLAARMAHPKNRIHDATQLVLPPYYPDTPKAREAWAAYYDVVTITDERIGELLQEIDDAGLRDNTVVFFWGDHGVGLARGKRWLYDSGVKVPLIVRWPGVIEPDSVRQDLAQFLDLAPTTLALGGVARPEHLHGRVLLGPDTEPAPERLFHARDRMDERYDMIRAVRDARYKYIRNFEAHKPWVQFMRTPSQGPLYQELGRLKTTGGLDVLTAPFMADTKPYEELYDTLVDPYEMHNLAGEPAYAARLESMRGQLLEWMARTNDHGLIPEPELYRTMYPENRVERTAPPTASKRAQPGGGATVALHSDEGASIAYTLDAAPQARWLVYSQPVKLSAGQTLRAHAVRLGLQDSEEVRVEN
ncbi:MAG: sulfatase-like hydrolase/transferase [Acidobacteria bacterium]|nr:sulfatase-like hydrolase/transferase [Acidobacteriota bacterium]